MTGEHPHRTAGEDTNTGAATRRAVCRAGVAGLLLALTGCASSSRSSARRRPLPEPREYTPLTRREKGYRVPSQPDTPPGAWTGAAIERAKWTREPPRAHLANSMTRPNRITVHHDGMSAFTETSGAAAMDRLERIRSAHIGQGWADIGYHFAVDPGGRVYQARPLTLQGAHVKNHNQGNIGVLVLGNYNRQAPTNATERALTSFLASLMDRYRVPASRVFTHQELRATACPGTSLQRFMVGVRRDGSLA
ncbi:MAG: peptidoglycan recognition family protein [Planctomycetota bacterium]